jgi:hypothetical protein
MRRLQIAGLLLVPALLCFPAAEAGAAKLHANKVKQAPSVIWTLAMDGSRVAYVSGGKIRVWNTANGATSIVKGRYGSTGKSALADDTASQVAIAGNRVAWIKRRAIGNTEASEKLYTSTIAGRAHLSAHSYRYGRDDPSLTNGSWIAGVVGSGGVLAVSTWKSDGTTSSNEKLSRITPTGLKTITTGPGAIVAEAGDGGHIAVLRDTAAWPSDGQPLSPTPTAGIYSTAGALEGEVALSPPNPDSAGIQLALAGKHLVVLTTGPHEPAGPAAVTLQVYDWTTGTLLDTWPVGIQKYLGEVSFAVHGQLAAVEGLGSLHLVNLATGKDVVIGPSSHTDSPPAMDSHGLVYAVNPHLKSPGKLVFVPMAKLLAAAS